VEAARPGSPLRGVRDDKGVERPLSGPELAAVSDPLLTFDKLSILRGG
jgi:hypothetical protein